jgi:phage terminase small subunit
MAEPASMVSAWREIGKMCGYYEPVTKKVDITVTQNGFKRLERLSDAELLELISTPAVLEVLEEENDDA